MMILSEVGGPGFGHSGLGLVEGSDYKCNQTICYGIADNHATLVALQQAINRWASKAGFKTIATDGFIGDGTVAAAAALGKWAMANSDVATTIGLVAPVLLMKNKAALAAAADSLVKALNTGANASQLPPPVVVAPTPPKSSPVQPPPGVETRPSDFTPPGQGSSNTLWWILGGLALAGSVTGVVIYKRKKGSGKSTAGRRAYA